MSNTKAIVSGHSRGLGAAIVGELLERGIPVLGLARHGNAALAAQHGDRLVEVALEHGTPAGHLVDYADEIDEAWSYANAGGRVALGVEGLDPAGAALQGHARRPGRSR